MRPHPEKSPLALSIRRHCMQNLLQSVLMNEHHSCSGLFARSGNIVESQLNVTQKMLSGEQQMMEHIKQQQTELADRHLRICGIYHSTHVSQANITLLIKLYQSALGHTPECYLLLDPDHLGRIDARLYHDAAHSQSISLNMIEDEAG